MPRTDLERIFQRVSVGSSGCWDYTGGINNCGYGIVSVNNRSMGAHKVAYLLRRGPIAEGLCVLHKCDNRRCINPDHLFLGTLGENNADRKRKGRNADRRGERNTMAKLTDSQVAEVRRLCDAGGLTRAQIARRVGISEGYVSELNRKVTRRELTTCRAPA